MDKTFEEIIGETLDELTSNEETDNETNLESDAEENSDEDMDESSEVNDEDDSEDPEDDSNESDEVEDDEDEDDVEEDLDEEDEVDSTPSSNQKDIEAFIRLRTENKQYKDTINFFDERAKAMGLSGIQDLIEKTKEAEIKKEAEKNNIPLEYAKRLRELEEKVAHQDAENANRIAMEKSNRVRNSLDSFVQANGLDSKAVQKLAGDLLTDGITLDFLSNVPENTIPRILKSYLPNEISKQKELEKKEKIKREVPLSSKSNTSNNTQEDEIDKIAKLLTSFH